MAYFAESIGTRNPQAKKVSFILEKLMGDALEEAAEVPPEILELYMSQAAGVLWYAATGETGSHIPIPDDFTPLSKNGDAVVVQLHRVSAAVGEIEP